LNVNLTAGVAGFETGMKKATGLLSKFRSSIGSVSGFLAGTGLTAGLLGIAKSTAGVGASLDDMSIRTGIAVEQLSALSYAAKFGDVSMQEITRAIGRMQKALVMTPDVFEKLGVNIEAMNAASPEKQLGMLADAIDRLPDPAQKTAAAMSIFGKAGQQLLPLFVGGSNGILRFTEEARRLGIVLSQEDVYAARDFDDSLDKLSLAVAGLKNRIGVELAPTLKSLADRIVTITPAIAQWIKDYGELLIVTAKLTTALIGLTATVVILTRAINALRVAFALLTASSLLGWIAKAGKLFGMIPGILRVIVREAKFVWLILLAVFSPSARIFRGILALSFALGGLAGTFIKQMLGVEKAVDRVGDKLILAGNRFQKLRDKSISTAGVFNPQPVEALRNRALGLAPVPVPEREKTFRQLLGEQKLKKLFGGIGDAGGVVGNLFSGITGRFGAAGGVLNNLLGRATNALAQNSPLKLGLSTQAPDLIEAGSSAAFQLGRNNEDNAQQKTAENTKQSRDALRDILVNIQQGLKTTLEGVSSIESFAG
jgi:TP901 family phage tail tape measure protein